ncbi:MAG: choice-of-anchor M domain-containing protein [Prosthecobacter sp.]|nr:choice-of-anchor M domain-containing protein [Prosthecobacter sp.]
MKAFLPLLLFSLGLLAAPQLSAHGGGHGGGGTPGSLSAYTAGHGDIGVAYEDGELELHLHLHEGAIVNGAPLDEDAELDPEDAIIVVPNATKQTASAAVAAGAGVAAGASLWVVPTASTPGVPFLGFAVEDLDPADWVGDIRFKVKEVISPSGSGHFSIYASDGLGGFDFIASTALGGLDEDDVISLPAGTHSHYFIAFSEPGEWAVEFEAEGEHAVDGEIESEHVVFTFQVGSFPWSAGHGDVGLAYEDGELDLHLHLHEGAVINEAALEAEAEFDPADVVIKVGEAAHQIASSAIAAGVGVSEGAPVWILPTAENAELPFVGFGTEELDPADWDGDLHLHLESVSSPSGTGHFTVYSSDGLGGFDFHMATADGIDTGDHLDLPAGTHAHYFIAFSEPGLWRVTMKAEGHHDVDGDVASEEVDFYFEVAPNSGGKIKLAQPLYTANQGATSVPVTLLREYGSLATTVTIEAEDGTASAVPPFAAGLVGRDYPAAMLELEVTFAEGEMSKTVLLTLTPRAGNVPNVRFNIHLHDAGADTEIGDEDEAEIRILAVDTLAPGLVISAPAAAGMTVSATSPYTVRGTVGDLRGVDRVEVALNGDTPVSATLGTAANTLSIPWSLPISPVAGPNTLEVTAYDLRGNARTLTRSFTFVQRHTLAVRRVGPVGVPLDQVGLIAFAATPMTAASTPLPLVPHASPRPYAVVPGTPLRLTATPRAGYLFSHWSAVPEGAVVSGSVITLTMPAGDLEAEAVFVANPVLPPVGQGSAFYGILMPNLGTAAGNDTVGYITGTMIPSSGLFSGRIFMNGVSQTFVATFFGNGSSLFTVAGVRVPTLSFDGGARVLTLSLDGSGGILAQVTAGSKNSSGTLLRAAHSSANPLPTSLLNDKFPPAAASNNRAYLTVALPSKEQTPPLALSSYPQGDGYGTLVVSSLGVATFAGILADGTAFTASSGVVGAAQIPFLAQLVTPGATTRGGSLSGTLVLDTSAEDSDVTGVNLSWFRPTVAQLPGATAAAQATQRYTAGWPDGIAVDAVGALYDRTRSVQDSLGLGAANASTGNGELEMTLGKLTGTPIGRVRVTQFNIVGNTVTKIPATNPSFSLTPVPSTGFFSGQFTPNWTAPSTLRPVFRGILLQKGAAKGGYGWFLSNRVGDLDPESGRATLGAP